MSRRNGKLAWLITLGYAVVLTVVSLLPSGGTGPLAGWDTAISPGLQNLLHVPAYGVLVWLTVRAMGLRRLRHLAMAAAACAAFGGLLECAQAAVPGRFGSVEDTLLNLISAAVTVPIVLAARRRSRRSEEPSTVAPDSVAHVSDGGR